MIIFIVINNVVNLYLVSDSKCMRVVVADMEAVYEGRGSTILPRGVRMLLIKGDNSVSIHNNVGNKPLNYMKTAVFTETVDSKGNPVWVFEARNEFLTVTMYSIVQDNAYEVMEDDPGLVRDGTEAHLQEWISNNMGAVFPDGFKFIQREFQTGYGAVDLLVEDPEGKPVCVEVKRTGLLGVVYQTKRYVESARELTSESTDYGYDFSETYGMIVALDIRPKTLVFAEKHKIECLIVPADWRSL